MKDDEMFPKHDLPRREDQVRSRQHGRAVVMAFLLGAFVVLIFAITISKMSHH